MDLFILIGSFMIALAVIKAKEGKKSMAYLLATATFLFTSFRLLNLSMTTDQIILRLILNALLCYGLVLAGQWLGRRIQH